jgi:mannose-6-phosphate isomerase
VLKPILIGPNPVRRFYRGGRAIAAFRGLGDPPEQNVPEDWVGSATTVLGTQDVGLSRIEGGRTLREAFAADPEGYFGPAHAEWLGGDPGILVKLLHAGERLPVHCHPDRSFARRHLNSPHGKTEAWVVLDAAATEPVVFLGFREEVSRETLEGWVFGQDRRELLAAMNGLPASVGSSFLVPAGIPHAIGEGILVVEIQEPTDISVLLEWEGYAVDGLREGHLGLGFDVALACVDRTGWRGAGLERLRSTRPGERRGVEVLFPAEADPYFRAERIRPDPESLLPASFAILVAVAGAGTLTPARGGAVAIRRGHTVLVPFAAGDCTLEGAVTVIRCMPPKPDCEAGSD